MFLAVLLGLGTAAFSATAEEMDIKAYRPSSPEAGGVLRVEGTFTKTREGCVLRYGLEGGAAAGELPVKSWDSREIRVRWPQGVAPGRYWVGIYRGDEEEARGPLGLTVSAPNRLVPRPGPRVPKPGSGFDRGVRGALK
jgi:hypothetical protein